MGEAASPRNGRAWEAARSGAGPVAEANELWGASVRGGGGGGEEQGTRQFSNLWQSSPGHSQEASSCPTTATGSGPGWLLPSPAMMARFEFLFEDVVGVSCWLRGLIHDGTRVMYVEGGSAEEITAEEAS